jgi:predicted acetyltransferase
MPLAASRTPNARPALCLRAPWPRLPLQAVLDVAELPRAVTTSSGEKGTRWMTVELVRASAGDKAVLRRLLQLYHYDFSEWNGDDVDEHGEFGHLYLDHYWTDADSHPLLIRHAGRWVGFALVRTAGVNDMSEFFVMRKYRRAGVGREAARRLFAMFPGAWQVRQLHGNDAATAFWRAVVPGGYEETAIDGGLVQRFTIWQ